MTEEDLKIADGAGPRALGKAVPPRDPTAADRVRMTEFPTGMRGYEREAVDSFMEQIADLIEALESRQARETVVQRALDEVGKETSAILKQAHESADDITARSRSQAEDRVEVARQEAAEIVREAREEAVALGRESDELRAERANLIEELRRFAAETLALADAAAERSEEAPPDGGVESPYDRVEEGGPVEEGPVVEGGPVDDIGPVEEWPPDDQTDELGVPAGEPPPGEPPR